MDVECLVLDFDALDPPAQRQARSDGRGPMAHTNVAVYRPPGTMKYSSGSLK
jgi:hypothetical protein